MEKQVEHSGISGTKWAVIAAVVLVALVTMAFYWDVGLEKIF